MRHIFLFMVLLLSVSSLCAQSPEWLWGSVAGGLEDDWGQAVAIDTLGNTYVAGIFEETAYFGEYSITSQTTWPNKNVFVAKADAQGNWLWAVSAGGTSDSGCNAITVDDEGDVYITGSFLETFNAGGLVVTSAGEADAYFAKLSTDGSWICLYSGGGVLGNDVGNDVTLDQWGTAYFVGEFYGDALFNGHETSSQGYNDAFIVSISPSGSWGGVMTLGGESWVEGKGIAFNSYGDMIVTGQYMGTMTIPGQSITSQGNTDVFIASYSYMGGWYWLRSAGGTSQDYGRRITTDADGNCYITGNFTNIATFGEDTFYGNSIDVFVAKLNSDGDWLWVKAAQGSGSDYVFDMDSDKSGNVYISGSLRGYLWFDSITLHTTLDCAGFLAKLDPSGEWAWAIQEGNDGMNYIRSIAVDKIGNVYCTLNFFDYIVLGDLYLSADRMTVSLAKYGIPDDTLPVVLSSLLVDYTGDLTAEVQWVTESETGILGFNILRSTDPDLSNALVLNYQIIDAGISLGAQTTYSYCDAELEPGNTYYYWLESVSLCGNSEYFGPLLLNMEQSEPEIEPELPVPVNALLRAFPNPFNPLVVIPFRLVEAALVEISICNSRGQVVKSFPSRSLDPGSYQRTWDGVSDRGTHSGSGVFIVKARINGRSYQSKIVMLK